MFTNHLRTEVEHVWKLSVYDVCPRDISARRCIIVLLTLEVQFCVRFLEISKPHASYVAVNYRSVRM
jgi:hypothetical protein